MRVGISELNRESQHFTSQTLSTKPMLDLLASILLRITNDSPIAH